MNDFNKKIKSDAQVVDKEINAMAMIIELLGVIK